MEEILTGGTKTLLKTSLSEEGYAKTKFSKNLESEGFVCTLLSDGNIDFKPWRFIGAVTIDDEVYFEGEGFEGKTISSILMDANSLCSNDGSGDERSCAAENRPNVERDNAAENCSNDDRGGTGTTGTTAKNALFLAVKVISAAIERNIFLPSNGVFGILYAKDEKTNEEKLLFAPEKAFDRCAMNLGKEAYSILQEPYRDSALKEQNALRFTQAVLAYFALTKTLPYPPKKTDKSVDISYKNFIPLEYKLNGIDKPLSDSISENLACRFDKKYFFPLETFKTELFNPELRKPTKTDKEFEDALKTFKKKQEKRITGTKKFNRAKGTALVVLAAFIFVSIFVLNATKENSKKPVTIGLSSSETTEMFYSGIHNMNTDYMLASAKNCPEAQSYISRIPQIYVTANMRAAYNFESGISTPENWMFFEPGSSRAYSHFIYGITNFTIDGNPSTLNNKIPTRKKHTPPLIKEDGERLNDFSKAEHKVHYFLVHNVDNFIKVEEFTTVIHLKWVKDRWQIAFLDEVSCADAIDPGIVSSAYKTVFEEAGDDYIKASLKLKETFPWLPTEKSLEEEKQRLDAIGYF